MSFEFSAAHRIPFRILIFAVLSVIANAALSQSTMSYGYDELGRLVSSTNTAGPDTGYDYDPANNRLTFSVLGAAASGAALPAASETGAQSAPSPQNVSEPVCSPVSGCAGK